MASSTFTLFTLLSALAAPAFAHLHITSPKPNGFDEGQANYKAPIGPAGGPFPCKGFTSGPSAATWEAGSNQQTVVSGSAVHGGGSCQVSLSYDQGATWTVMKTWIGECPIAAEANLPGDQDMPLDFTIPADAPPGEALFGWSWFNRLGNREMYHNCATVTITGSGTGKGEWAQLPPAFVANADNGCVTAESAVVEIPNPGPVVQRAPGVQAVPPVGNCPAGGPAQGPTNPAENGTPAAPQEGNAWENQQQQGAPQGEGEWQPDQQAEEGNEGGDWNQWNQQRRSIKFARDLN